MNFLIVHFITVKYEKEQNLTKSSQLEFDYIVWEINCKSLKASKLTSKYPPMCEQGHIRSEGQRSWT